MQVKRNASIGSSLSQARTALARVGLLLLLVSCTPSAERAGSESPAPTQKLEALFDEVWEARMQRNPLFATSVGDHRFGSRLPDVSPESLAAGADEARGFLERLDRLERDAASWPANRRADAAILRRQLDDAVAGFDFGAWQVPFVSDSGFHTELAGLPSAMPLRTVADFEDYLARLEATPGFVDRHVANMRLGLDRGFTMPRAILPGLQASIDPLAVDQPRDSVWWSPFEAMPESIDAASRERLQTAAESTLTEGVLPAFARLREFMRGEYRNGARESLGASRLPNGSAYYEQRVGHFTTLDLTAEEVHAIGRDEVARIRAEMQAIIDGLDFDGDFDAFLHFLRTDPQFYPQTAEELLMRASRIAKRMDAALPALFGNLPRLPYGVEPVPDHLAPNYTAGRYFPAPVGSDRAGTYWVNTHKLESRTLYTLEALTLHEAVPGHHLQIALAQEQGEQPAFRRFDYISAYGEGWGLYAEYLGREAGFYTDPYSDFGRLTYEMWRACRLVVDTGLHAMGWSRQEAVDFMAANTALSLHEVGTEVDRYISWPGQALSYKIGELKIKELRRRAEQQLGDRFDLRAFHDTVLGLGSVPLPILEDEIERWIACGGDATCSAEG